MTANPGPDGIPQGVNPIRWAWRKSCAGLAAVGLFSVVINILKLATPLYVLQILDRVIASRSQETLVMLTVITLVAIVAGVILEVIRRRMFAHWGTWIERTFGPRLVSGGLKSGTSQSPTSSKALRDVATLRSFVSGSALIAWLDVFWAPLFIACVFLISPPLAYVVLIGSLLALALGTVNELLTREARAARYEAGKDDRDWLASAERNRESLGSLNMVTNLTARWSRSAFVRLDEGMRAQTVNEYFSAGIRLVGRVLRIGIMGFGIWLVIQEVLTLGTVVAANVLGRIAYSLVQGAMFRWRDLITAKRAYARIKGVLGNDGTQQVSVQRTGSPVPLVIDNASYRYPNQANSVFRRLNVTVAPGEVLCVIGPSATGKTTFSRLASGSIAPRSGKIRLGDVDVHRLQQNSSQKEIGLLPQGFTLFQGTVRENIARLAEGDIGQVIRAAKLAGIHATILKLPRGYDTEISEDEPLLSSGQRKGLALARAFYGSPPLIVLDEPAPHLDRRARASLTDGIEQLQSEGSIVVVTTQSRSLSRIADKIIVFRSDSHDILQTPEEVTAFRQRRGASRRDRRRKRREAGDAAPSPDATDRSSG